MKVLFVTHYSSLYGANLSMLNLIDELVTNYNINVVVLIPVKGEIENILREKKIKYIISKYYLWMYKKDSSKMKMLTKSLFNLLLYYKIYFQIRKLRIDLIHTNSSTINVGGFLSQKMGTKHIWHIREFGEEDYNLLYNNGFKNAIKYYNNKSDFVIAISKSIKEKYEQYINKDKLVLVYNGIPTKQNNLDNYKQDRQNTALQIILTGVISENKNQLEALKAIRILKEHYNLGNFMLYFAGNGDERYIIKLKDYIREHELENHVKFLGYVKDVDSFLKQMDIGLITSRKEAFGRVTIEYMLNKMPVIGSKTGGTVELINHNVTGFLYELGNVDELAKYIKELIDNRDKRRKMGLNAYEDAIDRFSIEKTARDIYKLYLDCLQ